jgi:transcriptional regulator with XRE-family HTH domain
MKGERDLAGQRDLAVRKFLRLKRLERELTQRQLAALMGKPQSFVSDVENGQRRVTVSDFIAFSEALHFDARSAIRRIADTKPRPKPAEGQ